jgi:cytidine deaminase
MQTGEYSFSFKVYDDLNELPAEEKMLLKKAKEVSQDAYAPYSNFKVGAVAKMTTGEIVNGSNQENASFPVGLCAERVLLATVSSLYPGQAIDAIAITYKNANGESSHPVAPCGICRQSLLEFEERIGKPLKLILGGEQGKIFVIPNAGLLLPLAFNQEELKTGEKGNKKSS